MTALVTVSKKAGLKISATIAAVKNTREVGGLLLGYSRPSGYYIADATVPDRKKRSGQATFVLNGPEETAKAEALSTQYTDAPEIIGVWHSHIWGDAVFSLQDNAANRTLAQSLGTCLSAIALPEGSYGLRALAVWEIDPAGRAAICRVLHETENTV